MTSQIQPGLLVLHGNQLESLRDSTLDWLQQQPLDPLEPAVFLVQSNGIAEWLKTALAQRQGICAATQVLLPGRFLWDVYRHMLGRDAVPRRSAFDKSALTWRLMRLLPALLADPSFAPLRHFLADPDPQRRLQLAQRLADLFDQYQVYRADWLEDWAAGRDVLRRAQGDALPLSDVQRWQAQLWRAVIADMPSGTSGMGRAQVHRHFLAAIEAGQPPVERLPRRVVLLGISALPWQTLEALAALATHTQVIMAVPNPCQYYWGDIMDGRELMRSERRRHALRGGRELASVPLEDLHGFSHPLLASWGRLGRDFVRMLDTFDDVESARGRFTCPRVDVFSEGPGEHVLAQVQAAIRDLLPLQEHARAVVAASDTSIVFHIAHSAQREVEVLHDQLLAWLDVKQKPLRPRDVVVMVPNIESFAPAIRAVFGQYGRHDARYIPFEIGDVKDRSVNPLLLALTWLLALPTQRCRQSEIRDLLDVPAIAARFGLTADDLPRLAQWIDGAGIRWGLDTAHRAGLDLAAGGLDNTWLFGMRRMLLGYASGSSLAFADIEPYADVGGLDAALAGSLAQLVETLRTWNEWLQEPASPVVWGERARDLLLAFFRAESEADILTMTRLETALQQWLEACAEAAFDEAVPLGVLREAWLAGLDEPTLDHRFVSGGVTFCTLMPMRAVPFRVVCLLGMNEADFPRHAPRADFDLLIQAGLARPGDRSRRDDDRYLMLEALLAARDRLYISWAGRSVRDNSVQPPSVLVAQLRDYLTAGWQVDLRQLTQEHPLQPFSRRYFELAEIKPEADPYAKIPQTYAKEWRAAHATLPADANALPVFVPEPDQRLNIAELTRFLQQPARYFFLRRLGVFFGRDHEEAEDDEPFELDALDNYLLTESLLNDDQIADSAGEVAVQLAAKAQSLARQGKLPFGLIGQRWQSELVNQLVPVRLAWLDLKRCYPHSAEKLPLRLSHHGVKLEDWLDRMHSDGRKIVSLSQTPGKLLNAAGNIRADKLIAAWLRQLGAATLQQPVTGFLLGRDALIEMRAIDADAATQQWQALLLAWREGMNRPLPTACKTALAWLQDEQAAMIYDGGHNVTGEGTDTCLARLWPDFASLSAQEEWETWSAQLYRPLLDWLTEHVSVTPVAEWGHAEDDE